MKLILRLSLVVPWELDLTEERFDLRLFFEVFYSTQYHPLVVR
jgi:hypothetical protein